MRHIKSGLGSQSREAKGKDRLGLPSAMPVPAVIAAAVSLTAAVLLPTYVL